MNQQDSIIKFSKKKSKIKKNILYKFRQTFDPEKYKKPDPYHGYIHEQFIISSDNQIPRKIEEKKRSPNSLEIKDNKMKMSSKV